MTIENRKSSLDVARDPELAEGKIENPPSLAALLFDFDGVVVDSEPIHFEAMLSVVAQRYGVRFTEEQYYERYLAFTDAQGFEAVLSDLAVPHGPADIAELTRQKTLLVRRAFGSTVQPLAGAVEPDGRSPLGRVGGGHL